MFPLRFVILAISISMIFSPTVFGGESPKEDRIGIILSLMSGMRDRMDKMEKNIENINNKDSKIETEMAEMVKKTDATDSKISSMQSKISATDSKINGIDSKVSATDTKINGIDSKVSAADSKINGIKSDVSSTKSEVETIQKNVGWTFVGMGLTTSYDETYNVGDGYSLAGCIAVCTNKRSSNYMWNGVRFDPSTGWCGCAKNDGGHSAAVGYMHFKG